MESWTRAADLVGAVAGAGELLKELNEGAPDLLSVERQVLGQANGLQRKVIPPIPDAPGDFGEFCPRGPACSTCGHVHTGWSYNPFVKRSRDNAGWVWTEFVCELLEKRRPGNGVTVAERRSLRQWSQADVNRLFGSPQGRVLQTWELDCPSAAGVQALRTVIDEAWRDDLPRRSIYLSGFPLRWMLDLFRVFCDTRAGFEERHLILTASMLADQLTPQPFDTEEQGVLKIERRRVARVIEHLVIVRPLQHALAPSEVRHLCLTLEERAARGHATHILDTPRSSRCYSAALEPLVEVLAELKYGAIVLEETR